MPAEFSLLLLQAGQGAKRAKPSPEAHLRAPAHAVEEAGAAAGSGAGAAAAAAAAGAAGDAAAAIAEIHSNLICSICQVSTALADQWSWLAWLSTQCGCTWCVLPSWVVLRAAAALLQELMVTAHSMVACGHCFCGECLAGWLEKSNKQECAFCRSVAALAWPWWVGRADMRRQGGAAAIRDHCC